MREITFLSSRSGIPRSKRRGSARFGDAVISRLVGTVRENRLAFGLTQADLAGLSNTGVRFIVDLESGKRTLSLGKFLDVLVALGLTLRIVEIQASRREANSNGV